MASARVNQARRLCVVQRFALVLIFVVWIGLVDAQILDRRHKEGQVQRRFCLAETVEVDKADLTSRQQYLGRSKTAVRGR